MVGAWGEVLDVDGGCAALGIYWDGLLDGDFALGIEDGQGCVFAFGGWPMDLEGLLGGIGEQRGLAFAGGRDAGDGAEEDGMVLDCEGIANWCWVGDAELEPSEVAISRPNANVGCPRSGPLAIRSWHGEHCIGKRVGAQPYFACVDDGSGLEPTYIVGNPRIDGNAAPIESCCPQFRSFAMLRHGIQLEGEVGQAIVVEVELEGICKVVVLKAKWKAECGE